MGRQRLEAGQLWAAGGDEKNSCLTSPAAPSDARAPLLASNSVFVSLLQIECHCRNISAVRVVACSEKVWFSYVTKRPGSKQSRLRCFLSVQKTDVYPSSLLACCSWQLLIQTLHTQCSPKELAESPALSANTFQVFSSSPDCSFSYS